MGRSKLTRKPASSKDLFLALFPYSSSTFQVGRTDQDNDGTPNSEMRTANIANDYDATVKAFRGADAIIHLAAIPNPVDKDDWNVHK